MWRALLTFFSVAVFAQTPPEYRVEKLYGGLTYASGLAWSRDGFLLVADLPAGKITRIDDKGPSLFRDKAHFSAMAWDSEGRLLTCEPREHRVSRTDKKGRVETLAESFEGKRLNGPNGIAVSRNGHIWFTDGAFATADKQRQLSQNGVYHITPKGELSLAAGMTGRPNGIALSPDAKLLYAVDSDDRSILAWDVDKQGVVANQRVIARAANGVPNGILTGADGKLYIASRGIEMFSPGGEPRGFIEIAEKPADMVFGDGDLSTLYVAARTSVYRVRFATKAGQSN